MPYKAITAIAASITGAGTWAFVDGVLGTLAAVLAAVAAVLGMYWGYQRHKERRKEHALNLELKRLEIEEKRTELKANKPS